MSPLGYILLWVWGGYTASFLCVVVERRSVGLKPDGRSTCVCGKVIPMYRNIPVITWLLQRGRAHCCGARIPSWYFVSELLTAIAAVIGGALAGWLGGIAAIGLSGLVLWWWHARFVKESSGA